MKELDAEEMKRLDEMAVAEFRLKIKDLMGQAGFFVAEQAKKLEPESVAVCAGKGNNGGDAINAAARLAESGLEVVLVLAFPEQELGAHGQRELKAFRETEQEILVFEGAEDEEVASALAHADLIIDGLLGFGLKGEPRGKAAQLIELINAAGKKVLGVDVPSGFDVSEGRPAKTCVQAAVTVTFAAPKKGLARSEKAGQVFLADIGFPNALYERFGLDKEKLFQGQRLVKL